MATIAAQSHEKVSLEVICIKGQRALSDFRIKKLNQTLRNIDPDITIIDVAYRYYAQLSSVIDEENTSRLTALLLSNEPVTNLTRQSRQVTVVPRIGTISSWSSKATDITHACGITMIVRLERGMCFAYEAPESISIDQVNEIEQILHDRMTESILYKDMALASLFSEQAPQPFLSLIHI